MGISDAEIRKQVGITDERFYSEIKQTAQEIANYTIELLDLLEKLTAQRGRDASENR